jgi:RNA polymerase sigma-70 factor (ECF subfamily)
MPNSGLHHHAQGRVFVQDDLALLARARALDDEALGEIHDRYYRAVFRYVSFRVSDTALAEDLASEVFARFLGALRDPHSPPNSLKGWLFGVASRVVSDHYRQHYRTAEVELDEAIASREDGPSEIVDTLLAHDDLQRAMAHLTAEQQQVLALRFTQGMSIRETAELMNRHEGAVKQLQARALAALARKLGG